MGKILSPTLDSPVEGLYGGGMAKIIYSTGYNGGGTGVWETYGRMTGFFQIKDDCPEDTGYWSGFMSPCPGYEYNDFGDLGSVALIDYDTARHWPHP